MKDFAIRNPNILFRKELISLEESIDRLAKGLLGGRIEHESLPDLNKTLAELTPILKPASLELLKSALSNNSSEDRKERTEAAITRQLKVYLDQVGLIDPDFAAVQNFAFNFFSEKEPALANRKLQSKASFLVYLRDIALELALFLQRPIADSLQDFIQLYHLKQKEVADRASHFVLSKAELKAANEFLCVSASLVILQKVQMVAEDYIKSGTDIKMANGRIWASRYNRYDYLPFFFEPIKDLESKYPFNFSNKELLEQLTSIRVKIKAESLSTAIVTKSEDSRSVSAQTRMLEIKTLFGLVFNFTFSDWQQWVTILLQIMDVKSIQALEGEQALSQINIHKISRVRYFIHLYSVLYHDSFRRSRNLKLTEEQKEKVLESALKDCEKIFSKLKFELEVIGLSQLTVGTDAQKHGKLEGLSGWVSRIIDKESFYFKYRISYELGLYEHAYKHFSDYLISILGIDKSLNFSDLSAEIKLNSRNGTQQDSFWFSEKAQVYGDSFISLIIDGMKKDSSAAMDFLKALPILTRLAAEFGDFDKGLALMIAHRHLWYEIWHAKEIPQSLEQLIDIIDAEVRFRFGYRKAGASKPQLSAVKLLSDQQTDFIKSFSKDLDFQSLANTIMQDAIHGQYLSTQIRHLREYSRLVKSKSYARSMAKLVMKTVVSRLIVSKKDFSEVSALFNSNLEHKKTDGKMLLLAKEIESRAIAATKMLLDCSLVCAEMSDNKTSRELLEFCISSYSQILPGLTSLVSWVLAANSIEEFRRRIEKAITIIKEESETDYVCLSAANSGVLLGFQDYLSNENASIEKKMSECAQLLKLVSAIRRRRIIVGRCGVLERYQDSYHAIQRQRIFASAMLAVNDGFSKM